MPYFDEPVGRVKIQHTNKRVIQHAKLVCLWEANFADIYLREMRDRSKRSGMELAREFQVTDWSKAGNLSNRFSSQSTNTAR